MSYAIVTRDLTKKFLQVKGYRNLLLHPFRRKEIVALHDITIKVRKGEVVSLLGCTGAGKTTLIKILCNLILPTTGEAFVNGYDITKSSKKIRKSIGYVLSDERSFYWRLTGRQNLKFFSVMNNIPSKQADRIIEEILEVIGMATEADNIFKNYSAGQRQKMAIARGLLTDPQILFMDEPTKSLDPIAAQNFREFIRRKRIREKGNTILLATHNLSEAEALSDRIAIIHNGKIMAHGSSDEIKKDITDNKRYKLELAFPTNEVLQKLKQILNSNQFTYSLYQEMREKIVLKIEIKNPQNTISKIVKNIVFAGGELLSCTSEDGTLQEAFEKMVGVSHLDYS